MSYILEEGMERRGGGVIAKTTSSTELMDWPWERTRAYSTRPMLSVNLSGELGKIELVTSER